MTFADTLPIIINVLLIILLIVVIILAIKCIIVVDKADKICDNVEKKVNTLNGLFETISFIDGKISGLFSLAVGGLDGLFDRFFKKKEDDEE